MMKKKSLFLFAPNERGANMAEYAIVMAAIVLVGWTAMKVLGVNISDFIQGVAGHF